ncbi:MULTISPECIES: DUF3221 domain-containing protein [Cytobacillus]|uniref:DUF3221 domain-containing protein n=2 Tax=Bacillaceae TaxID=186817 RepID=A0A248TFK0_9BACI|nr:MULTISPECIES: DUF3221 domain-containing protein [Cytobacillus]ASV66967.1 hypothetical protein CKF48_06280 [Cytobacillus kochii]MEA1854579.1 DUF3221 domain-containing protein [Cytobacillus sp. OWB-43]
MKILREYLICTLALFLIISIGGFLFFTYTPTYKGVIIESGQSIWVVADAENIKYKSKQELRETYMYQGVEFTLPTYMPEKKVGQLSVGDEVIIYFSGEIRASAPGGGDAYWVSLIKK